MKDMQKNHSIGKRGEKETWPFLEKNGFIRPSKDQRKMIKEFYEKRGKQIEKKAFDVISLDEIGFIGKKAITLYEVKTTGVERGKFIDEDFKEFGFTLPEKEINNAEVLKSKYKFIFVNLYSGIFKLYRLNDFLNENISNYYKTYSVFIRKKIKNVK